MFSSFGVNCDGSDRDDFDICAFTRFDTFSKRFCDSKLILLAVNMNDDPWKKTKVRSLFMSACTQFDTYSSSSSCGVCGVRLLKVFHCIKPKLLAVKLNDDRVAAAGRLCVVCVVCVRRHD